MERDSRGVVDDALTKHREKMRIIIDIGNTNAKYVLSEGTQLVGEVYRCAHADIVASVVIICAEHNVSEGMLASVAECGDDVLEQLRATGLDIRPFNVQCPLPITVDYATPETLGADRVAAVVGAVARFGKCRMLVIDAGTAVTYDYVNADGCYVGGCISPGLSMRFKALNTFTSKLPLVDVSDYKQSIGDSTASAIASGVLDGFRYEVNGYINQFCVNNNETNKIIVTGGDHKYLVLPLKSPTFAVSNLVLEGIAFVANTFFDKK
jgi:type III pantothenate kinase